MKVTSLFQEIEKKFIDALRNIQSINDDEYNSDFEKHKDEFMKDLIDLQSNYPLLTHHNLSAFNTDPKKMLDQVIANQQTGDCEGFLPSGFSCVFDFDKFKVCQPAVIDISEKPHVFIAYRNEETINDLQEFLLNVLLSHPLGKAHISVVTFDRGVLLPHLMQLPDSLISKVSNMVECNMIGDNIIKQNEGYVQFKDDSEAITEYVVLIGHPHSFSSQTLIDTYKYILHSKQSRNAHIILVDLYKTESFSSVFPLDNCHKIVVSENIHDIKGERLINNPILLSDCLAYLGKYEGERHVVQQTTQDNVDFLSKECAELSKQNRKQLDQIRELEANIVQLQKELQKKNDEIASLWKNFEEKEKEFNSLVNDIIQNNGRLSQKNMEGLMSNNVIVKYKTAAEYGDASAQFNLGLCYEKGNGVIKDMNKAVQWYQKSAAQGHAPAQCILGKCYENGNGVEQDYRKAFEWYTKAAEQGHAPAQFYLGLCYENGNGVIAELGNTNLSSELNNAKADLERIQKEIKGCENKMIHMEKICREYGHHMYSGKEEKKKIEELKPQVEPAKERVKKAQNNLLYAAQKAIDWYNNAAEKKYAEALYYLGVCYENGKGLHKDSNKAFELYTQAAEQGYADAQYKLGMAYENDDDIKDLSLAAKWFTKAAEQGHNEAKHELGMFYFYGKGVKKDEKKAKELLDASGYSSSYDYLVKKKNAVGVTFRYYYKNRSRERGAILGEKKYYALLSGGQKAINNYIAANWNGDEFYIENATMEEDSFWKEYGDDDVIKDF